MKTIFSGLCLLLCCQLSARDVLVLDAKNYFGGLSISRRLRGEIRDGKLCLNILGRDSGIGSDSVEIEPTGVDLVEIRYRASGLPPKTGGQLFFSEEGKDFSPRNCWLLPSLISDGQEHIITAVPPPSWRNSGMVKRIRLDMVDEGPGGTIEIFSIVFKNKEKTEKTPAFKQEQKTEKALSRPCNAADEYIFDASNNFGSFKLPRRLNAKVENGELLLEITGKDSGISADNLDIDPRKINVVEITYRTEKIGNDSGGQLYFSTSGKDFKPRDFWHLSSVIDDGKEHVMIQKAPLRWKEAGGRIKLLRLDMVNEGVGGKIWIKSIRFGEKPSRLKKVPPKVNEFTLDAGSGLFDFNIPTRLVCRNENGKLILEVKAKDSYVVNRNVLLNPAGLTILEIGYRATGFPETTNGQLYFTSDGEPLNPKNFWALPSLVSDGQFHIMRLVAPRSWTECRVIDSLRLDLVDQGPGGRAEIEFIRFRKGDSGEPIAHWPEVKSVLPPRQVLIPSIPKDYYAAKMVCAEADDQKQAGVFYLRKKFQAPEYVDRAILQVSADDKYRLFINGRLIADRMRQNSWKVPQVYDLDRELLLGKENLIAIQYRNDNGPGGVLFELAVRTKNGRIVKFLSQEGTLSSAEEFPGWEKQNFDDASWRPVRVMGTPPEVPWTRVLPYQALKSSARIEVKQIEFPGEVVAGTPLCVKLFADVPDGTYTLDAELQSQYGKPLRNYSLEVKSRNGVLTFSVELPRYYATAPMQLALTAREMELHFAGKKISFSYLQKNIAGKKTTVTISKDASGTPRIFIDGQARYCLFLSTAIGVKKQKGGIGDLSDFSETVIIQNSPANEWQIAPRKYDFSVIDREINNTLEVDPEHLVILAIGLEPASWWTQKYYEQIACFSDGTQCFSYAATPSFASKIWLDDTVAALKALIGHLEKAPYASRMGGYLLTNGKSLEWQYWGGHESRKKKALVDYSEPMRKYFRQRFGREMPAAGSRFKASRGVFFDPNTEADKIAANAVLSDVLADFMIVCINTVRNSLTIPKMIGVYYGYHFEYANLNWTRALCGHNDLARVLKEGRPDFIYSPNSYGYRQLGEAGGDMKPFSSIEQNGSLSILEDDTRTHLIPYSYHSQAVTPEQTRNIMRRNMGMALCRGQNMCLVPLFGGNEFNSPEVISDLKTIKQAGIRTIERGNRRKAEIAVVVDEKGGDYLAFADKIYRNYPRKEYRADGKVSHYNAETLELTGNLVSVQRARIAKIGAPVDYILSSDVRRNIGNYKLWIFLDTFTQNDSLSDAVARLRTGRNVLLWFYAPGVIRGKTFGAKNISRLIGINVREISSGGSPEICLSNGRICGFPEDLPLLYAPDDPSAKIIGTYAGTSLSAAAEKKTGEAKDVFWGGNVMSTALFRKYAKEAGVHIYCDSDDVLFAGFGYITFHAAFPGRKVIRLPENSTVRDLFSGEVLAEKTDRFSFDVGLHESRIFEIIRPCGLRPPLTAQITRSPGIAGVFGK